MSRKQATLSVEDLQIHYDRVVQDLVDAHVRLKRSPLLLAIRYDSRETFDVHMLEVIENFPGSEEDPLFTTEFSPNERLLLLGKLHLVLASPEQLEHAVGLAHTTNRSKAAKDARRITTAVEQFGEVLFKATTPSTRARTASRLKKSLGLS